MESLKSVSLDFWGGKHEDRRATVELVRILQADAQRIMQSRQEEEGELPLFDEIAVERLMNAFQPVEFRQVVRLGSGPQVTFYPAGHIAGAAFPPEARLRKVGVDVHRCWMTLTFDFPGVAAERYAEQIDLLMAQTGWEVVYHPQVNQQALSMAVLDVLQPGARISKGPSYFTDRHEVQVG